MISFENGDVEPDEVVAREHDGSLVPASEVAEGEGAWRLGNPVPNGSGERFPDFFLGKRKG